MAVIERTLQFDIGEGFRQGGDLRPAHCDALEAACLQNGDTETLEIVERARRNWSDAKDKIFALLTMGYRVYVNDAPKITK